MSVMTMARIPLATGLLLVGAVASGAAQDKDELEKCEKPIGTLAVVEPQHEDILALQRYNLGSPVGLIRMMVQQSKCFLVVERGVAMQNIQQERALARSGEMQQDANMGGGQMKAADFILTPAVVISNPNAGGVGGAVGGLLGRGTLGAVGGGLKFKEAQTSMLVADARTTIQVVAAQGKAKKSNFSSGAIGWAGGAGMAGGGYTNTAEGKVIAASYLDNYNNIVKALKVDAELMARAEKFKVTGTSGAEVKAGSVFAEGDVLIPKIDNVKLFAEAKDSATAIGTLKKGGELVFLGEEVGGFLKVHASSVEGLVFLGDEVGGFLKVQTSSAEGWVKKTLVSKR